jgi:30S ribosomal protein S31
MGKGDKKSRKGKINNGSYGKRRPRRKSKSAVASEGKSKN